MAHHKGKAKVEKDTAERWLLTYADLMNLLLILFILLYTMANVDVAKYQTVAQSLRAAFGETAAKQIIGEGGVGVSLVEMEASAPSPVVPAQLEQQQMHELSEKVAEFIKNEGLSGQVDVSIQERGIVITIEEKVLFKSGSADIEVESRNTILTIGKILLAVPSKHIRIEGHTDNAPINTARFPDNWELSTARANSVLRILVEKGGIDAMVISATGYGEFRPKVPNDSVEHMTQNRRVDIAILNDIYNKSESGVSMTLDN